MIPRWIPQTMVDGGWLFSGRPHIREQLERDGLRFVCHKLHQDVEIWVRRRWALIARIEYWYWQHEWWLYQYAVRLGFLVGEEGDYYANHRFTWRFWLGLQQRAYHRGFREALAQARFVFADREKADYRRGRRHGFFLGGDYYRRHMLRDLRKIRGEVREIRASISDNLSGQT